MDTNVKPEQTLRAKSSTQKWRGKAVRGVGVFGRMLLILLPWGWACWYSGSIAQRAGAEIVCWLLEAGAAATVGIGLLALGTQASSESDRTQVDRIATRCLGLAGWMMAAAMVRWLARHAEDYYGYWSFLPAPGWFEATVDILDVIAPALVAPGCYWLFAPTPAVPAARPAPPEPWPFSCRTDPARN